MKDEIASDLALLFAKHPDVYCTIQTKQKIIDTFQLYFESEVRQQVSFHLAKVQTDLDNEKLRQKNLMDHEALLEKCDP